MNKLLLFSLVLLAACKAGRPARKLLGPLVPGLEEKGAWTPLRIGGTSGALVYYSDTLIGRDKYLVLQLPSPERDEALERMILAGVDLLPDLVAELKERGEMGIVIDLRLVGDGSSVSLVLGVEESALPVIVLYDQWSQERYKELSGVLMNLPGISWWTLDSKYFRDCFHRSPVVL